MPAFPESIPPDTSIRNRAGKFFETGCRRTMVETGYFTDTTILSIVKNLMMESVTGVNGTDKNRSQVSRGCLSALSPRAYWSRHHILPTPSVPKQPNHCRYPRRGQLRQFHFRCPVLKPPSCHLLRYEWQSINRTASNPLPSISSIPAWESSWIEFWIKANSPFNKISFSLNSQERKLRLSYHLHECFSPSLCSNYFIAKPMVTAIKMKIVPNTNKNPLHFWSGISPISPILRFFMTIPKHTGSDLLIQEEGIHKAKPGASYLRW